MLTNRTEYQRQWNKNPPKEGFKQSKTIADINRLVYMGLSRVQIALALNLNPQYVQFLINKSKGLTDFLGWDWRHAY